MNSVRCLLFIILEFVFSIGLFAQKPPIEALPFLLNDDHIIVKLNINGQGPFNFLFDTGAGTTLISKSLSDSLKLQKGKKRNNTGAAGTQKAAIIKNISIGLGNATIKNVDGLESVKAMEELDNGETIYGIIGYHILTNYVVSINFDKGYLYLFDKAKFKYSGNGKKLPFRLIFNLPIAEAMVSISGDSVFVGAYLIDTGSRSTVIFSSPTVDQYNMIPALPDYYSLKTNLGSSNRKTKLFFGRIGSLDLAGSKFYNMPASFSRSDKGVLSLYDFDGIIGNRVLKRFNIVFDYEHATMYLEPNSNLKASFPVNVSGFSLKFENGIPIVRNLIDQSQANQAGLKNGDIIISIDGILTETMLSKDLRQSFKDSGTTLKLVIKRGRKLKYTEIKLKPLI